MTTWVRAERRERPGQFAVLVTLVTLVTTSAAHLLAGGTFPGLPGFVVLAAGLTALGFAARRWAGGPVRLMLFLALGQVLGHIAFELGTVAVPTHSAVGPRSSAHLSAAPCALHDLSALTLPTASGAHSGSPLSPMVVAHLLAVATTIVGVRLLTGLARRARRWLSVVARRLGGRVIVTVRYQPRTGYIAPSWAPRAHRLTPLRGPPQLA